MAPRLVAEGQPAPGGTRWFDLEDSATGAGIFLWVPPGKLPRDGWPSLTAMR